MYSGFSGKTPEKSNTDYQRISDLRQKRRNLMQTGLSSFGRGYLLSGIFSKKEAWRQTLFHPAIVNKSIIKAVCIRKVLYLHINIIKKNREQ